MAQLASFLDKNINDFSRPSPGNVNDWESGTVALRGAETSIVTGGLSSLKS